MIEEITEEVIRRINQRYILVEKTFNLSSHIEEGDIKIRMFTENIIEVACKYFYVEKIDFKSGAHLRGPFKKVAMCYVALCRELPEEPISYTKIGFQIKKDHATIMNIKNKWEQKMEKDFEFRQDYNAVKKQVEESLKV